MCSNMWGKHRIHPCPILRHYKTSNALSLTLFTSDAPPAKSSEGQTANMPADYNGTWDIISNDNIDGYMVALGIDFATRKIASLLKPRKVIKQDGDSFTFQTVTTLKNYECSFKIGEEFDEVTKGMDNRLCKSVVTWDNDKLVCVQKGEKGNRGWVHWIQGDELHLELKCEGQVCKQIYKRTQ
ncbi:retinoid-binding protein 7 [Kryptolebias marmoratus]|uniref:Cellular retinoic acid-binding protein 1 n=1 Tax=Kryptolebias marmoratus TaxID=37003 RepID=A0A3Q3F2W7_KRYMA|nr:retinoid-binding protein 7 [Kryptolebias marmoratus]